MSYSTFIPTIESSKMLNELDKYLCMVAHCTREYEGEVKRKGDSIRIKTLGKPTITDLVKDEKGANGKTGKQTVHSNIGEAEELTGAEILLQINQISTWNYQIGDIDQAQSEDKGIMSKARTGTAKALAERFDKFVASLMVNEEKCRVKDATISGYTNGAYKIANETGTGTISPLDLIDEIVLKANQNNITDSTQLVCECSPKLWKVLKHAYRDLDTDNSEMLAGRKCGRYNDVKIVKTNNTVVNNKEYMFVRTTDSVAFINPLTENEAYRPEKGFADCVKGFTLYDGKVVKPNEVFVCEITY